MKISKNIVYIITLLIGSQYGFSQCDENVWNESWTSCELKPSPNSLRGDSHWLLYEFDVAQPITDMHIWNANKTGESNLGVENASIDYSIDGSSWVELGDYTFSRADESARYEGFDGPSLGGITVRKILFTFHSNFDSSNPRCVSIAEIAFKMGQEVPTPESKLVHIRKRNAQDFAVDGNHGGADGQNVYLWSADPENINQQWLEIDRGNGYYSYQKNRTDFCLDGDNGRGNKPNVRLMTCNENDLDQHWQKVEVEDGAFKLLKRNALGFALDGQNGGANKQNVNLYNSANTSQNLQWVITPIDDSSTALQSEIENGVISMFPNPVIKEITVGGAENSTVQVYDLAGRTLLTTTISGDSETLDLGGLQPGIYVVEIQTGTEVYSRKIVKQ